MNETRIEPIWGAPEFLQLGAVQAGGVVFELVSRRKLDTRAIVPWFEVGGETIVGICVRERSTRAIRGIPTIGWEAFGSDLSEADETSDIARFSEQRFTERTGLEPDPNQAPMALPSFARSIGYLCELCLPLLLPILPPAHAEIELQIPKGAKLIFLPLRMALARLDAKDAPPHAEELELMLRALAGPSSPDIPDEDADLPVPYSDRAAGDRLLAASAAKIRRADQLRAEAGGNSGYTRSPAPRADALRFLKLSRVTANAPPIEAVTPASGVSLALLPYIETSSGPHFLLWDELRPSAIERQARAPLFDLPVALRYLNATGFFLPPELAAEVNKGDLSVLEDAAPKLLARVLGQEVPFRSFRLLGRASEPAPAISSEVRLSAAVELDISALQSLPEDARLISADELSRAIGEGRVRDPVVISGWLRLAHSMVKSGLPPLDPFAAAREADPENRREFLSTMTRGSEVQRRLSSYSSIEAEQLAAPTYARLMTLLQHEHGLRIAYPKTENDRTFFKAAFRVFMAADRGDDDRALQGLHWSHDAFHFALGNFIVEPPPDFASWYTSGADAPAEQPPQGPAWETYSRALKAAENEATFFSFWTLYDENFKLARHVGKLTYYEALRELGITDRKTAREIYDDVVDRAILPERIRTDPKYMVRADLRGLFDYMLGFRPYHFKDIAAAWKYAVRDPYRGYLARFAIYERDLEKYLANVSGFCARLASLPRGLNPVLCALADARLDLNLRVWDVTKALRLLRAGSLKAAPGAGAALRTGFLQQAEPHLKQLEEIQKELAALRSQVHDAELTPRNEMTLDYIKLHAEQIDGVRKAIWDWVEASKLVAPDKVAAERARELPR